MPSTAAADSLGGPVLRDGPANGLSTAEGPFGRTDVHGRTRTLATVVEAVRLTFFA